MKRKLLNLMLSLIFLFTMAAIVAPVSADYDPDKTSTVGTGGTYDPANYDVRYVHSQGDDGNTGTTADPGDPVNGPWRTITHACDMLPFTGVLPDLIVVLEPQTYYGGSDGINEEIIEIHYPVTLVSDQGDEATEVNVTDQDVVPMVVILITCSNVIVDGLTLIGNAGTGTFVGILVNPELSPLYVPEFGKKTYIENVKILNCTIKIDDCEADEDCVGIEMIQVKYAVIDNNNIYVGTMGYDLECPIEAAGFFDGNIGILMDDCFSATITNNDIDVQDEFEASGIAMDECPKSIVGGQGNANDIDVRAAEDAVVHGIKVDDSDLIQILYNKVCVSSESKYSVKGIGIKVEDSDRFSIIDNDPVHVFIELTAESPGKGILIGRGIEVEDSDEGNVASNNVEVQGIANIGLNVLGLDFAALDGDILDDLEDLAEDLLETLGKQSLYSFKLGTIKGIYMDNCDAGCMVQSNTVATLLDVEGYTSVGIDTMGAAGYNAGIKCYKSSDITVKDNIVDMAKTLVDVRADVGQKFFCDPPAYLSVAHGIVLHQCGNGAVEGNTSIADADLIADLIDVGDWLFSAEEAESVISLFSSEVLTGILESVYETGDAAVEISGNGDLNPTFWPLWPEPILGIAASTGILALKSDYVSIMANPMVSGDAYANVMLEAEDESFFILPNVCEGGGMAFGIGIGVIDCDGPTVSGNGHGMLPENGVWGTGETALTVKCGTPSVPMEEDSTVAYGEGAAVGVGILLVRDPDDIDAKWYDGGFPWCTPAVVTENVAHGSADACPTLIQSATEVTGMFTFATAEGNSIAVAMGIAADNYHGILIAGNEATANAEACLNVDAYGEDTYCPNAEGNAVAIGAGISATRSFGAQIINNSVVEGIGTAESNITADEDWSTADAKGEGGALGVGIGIIVFECPHGLIQGNSHIEDCEILGAVTGLGDAECNVNATTDVPLNEAEAMSMAVGIGIGIGVMESPKTDVLRCNVATGEGTARVTSTAEGDFDYAYHCGFAGDYDIIMKLHYQRCFGFTEEDIDAEGMCWWRFGHVNYNSMVDYEGALPDTGMSVLEDDAGLLKIGKPCLDATLNWWNDPTGPSGMGPGIVKEYVTGKFAPEPVMWELGWLVCPVEFTPWLYVDHAEVLCEQIGKFGFYVPMTKGLNTFSTPIALEESVIQSRTWGDIWANSDLAGKVKWIDRWDEGTQTWEPVQSGDYIDPLHAFYIYMFSGANIILYVNSDSGHPYSMPTRELPAEWSLIGPNPQWPPWPGMPVRPALTSILLTPAALPGYTQAISPNVFSQPAWVFVPTMPGPGPMMLSGRGYWVWMENLDTLVGFGFSPLPAGP